MISRTIFIAVFALATAGCQAPLVALHSVSSQPKVEYVNDWHGLAESTATKFAATLHMEPPSVFVASGPSDMPFAEAYKKFLEKALMDRGYPVIESASGAVVLNFDVQTFVYAGKQRLPLGPAPFTEAGALYAIATQLRHVSSIDTGAGIAAGAGVVADLLTAINDKTNAEVLLTLKVTDGTHIHYLETQSFYVQPSDLPFYWTNVPDRLPVLTSPIDSRLALVSMPITSSGRFNH